MIDAAGELVLAINVDVDDSLQVVLNLTMLNVTLETSALNVIKHREVHI